MPRAAPKPAAKPEPARIDAPNPDQANIAGAPGEAPRDTPKVPAKADADIAGRIEKAPPKAPGEAPAEGAPRSAEIVSIDRFRKK